ncbi:hypothetical protein LSH36_216g00008 [Paralvinella palmiformis]|uniref:Bola-like protein n=1 Tax=Paralvinella palmiformis TaxID=53620 RepID=A0AAD9JQK3_9ANNE|nr:hypothetical protein LSH36_216g00008 [Paralvinella palmiformis]
MTHALKTIYRTAVNCLPRRSYSVEIPPETFTEGELKLIRKLKDKFPKATYLNVKDVGDGCGTMYSVQIEAEEFRGKRLVLQHRMVNEALKDELKDIHALSVDTLVPKSSGS